MSKRDTLALEAALGGLGTFAADPRSGAVFGRCGGYLLAVCRSPVRRGVFTIHTSACRTGEAPPRRLLASGVRRSRALRSVGVRQYAVVFTVKAYPFSLKKTLARLPEAVQDAVRILDEAGCACCCRDTGSTYDLDLYMCRGTPAVLNRNAWARRSETAVRAEQDRRLRRDNVPAGLLGAFLGSTLGALLIVLLGWLGAFSAPGALLLALLAVKGYDLLSGRMGRIGAALCLLPIAGMTYIGVRGDWALAITRQVPQYGFAESFGNIPYWLSVGSLKPSAFWQDVAFAELAAACGAFAAVRRSMRPAPVSEVLYRMGEETP